MTEDLNVRFFKARQAYISSQFSHLNNMQMQAVLSTDGPLLLLAGAGSGKTTVLINRIENLIRFGNASESVLIPDTISEDDVLFLELLTAEMTPYDRQRADWLCAQDPVAPWNVLAITFTNKAANELKERLVAKLGIKARDVWAMTFHSACCRILRRDIERIGFTSSFTIYDTSDSERIMKDIIKDMGLDDKTFPAKYVLSIISREKDKMTTPDTLLEQAENLGDMRMLPVARAYKKYQARLRDNNALDFDDIILYTVKLLQEHEDVRVYYQRKFRYVLVDEYQDTNNLQYLLTSLLAGGYENICVVGDDDQSIYRFRGATIENILDFEKQYKGCRTIRLEQNYRSTQAILNAANSVIAHNIGRKGKHLWTANGAGQPIIVYEAADESAEASFVANEIIKQSKGRNFENFAVLYRTNAQSNALEYAMKRSGIPYRIIGGTRFFDRAEIKDMLAYLCVINNRTDDLRLKRIINNPPRGIGAKSLETAERLAQAEGASLYQVISDPRSYAALEKPAGKFLQFSSLIEEMAQFLENGMSLPDFYEELIIRCGYQDMLLAKDTEENRTRLENVRELKSSIRSYEASATENGDIPSLSGFLAEIALYTDLEQYNEGDNAIVMMTMHSSKGLEFPHVYLVGLEEGLFPGMRAIGDRDEMEEERRLCYVAITRAKNTLTICHARQRMLYGRTSAALPSRFLKELPESEILKKGYSLSTNSRYTGFGSVSTPGYSVVSQPTKINSFAKTANTSVNTQVLDFAKGDMVQHTAFGRGMVLSVMKMGGDALLEVAFDKVGTKKLMAKTASAHMKKL